MLLFRLLTWILIIPVGFGVLGIWRHRIRTQKVRLSAEAAD